MRKILLTPIFLLFLSSCSVFRQPVVMISTNLDYSEYLKEGMFLSESNAVNFSYEPISSVSALLLSGYAIKSTGEKEFRDDAYQTSQGQAQITITTNKYISASKEEVLKQIVKEAKSKNANAIINLEIKPVIGVNAKGYSYLQGYSASGMAIKK
jgi:uncharacterized protein YbjQ (UPF0145 family)